MSLSTAAQDSIVNSPIVNSIVQWIVGLQNQPFFSRDRIQNLPQNFLLSVGFSVLLYCLFHIQILFVWFIKLIFYFICQILWLIFCFPFKTLGLLVPKTLNYDILFPLFWLCSVASFYVSKNFHENLWQFFDKHLVERYKLIKYQTNKREEVRRNLFLTCFVVLLLLQSLFILLPIAQSIKHNRQQAEKSSFPISDETRVSTTSVKSSSQSLTEKYYNRFVNAFKDQPRQHSLDENDQDIEVTLKTIRTVHPEKKRSIFQRWFVDSLRSMFNYDYSQSFDRSQDDLRLETHQIDGQHAKNEQSVDSSSMIDEHEQRNEEDNNGKQKSHDATNLDRKSAEQSIKSPSKLETLGESFRYLFKHPISSSRQEESFDATAEEDRKSSSTKQSFDENLGQPSAIGEYDDEAIVESDDEDEEEEQSSSIFQRMKSGFIKPLENVAQHLFTPADKEKFRENNVSNGKNGRTKLNDDGIQDSLISRQVKSSKKLGKSKTKDQTGKRKVKGTKRKSSKKNFRPKKLNGWLDDPWNVWHLDKPKLSQIYTSKSKHARHFALPNMTSIYTAFTDLKCFDYTKKTTPYRVVKNAHLSFLNSYRRHSPFPVYLSVLKSNGPKSYRLYPDSSCGIILKSQKRNILRQLYRFVRFWFITGFIICLTAYIYQCLTGRKTFRRISMDLSNSFDQLTDRQHRSSLTGTTTTPIVSNVRQKIPLDENIRNQFEMLLRAERNDGFRRLSGDARNALNATFLNQRERINVRTLQFAEVQICDVTQYENEKDSTDKMVINGTFEIDRFVLDLMQTFKEKQFSFEARKLRAQIHVLLFMEPSQYRVEVNLRQVQLTSPKIIDPEKLFIGNETQMITKTIEETIQKTSIQSFFQLINNQSVERQTPSATSQFETNKTESPIRSTTPKTPTPSTYSPVQPTSPVSHRSLEVSPLPVLTEQLSSSFNVEQEPKRLMVRVVKAVKLHDVEQPYCILELNHPKQFYKTSIANNGVNPFWDERFPFECDEKSDQIRLKIINRKYTANHNGTSYVDSVYADVTIPFSYVTSTVYKEDIQISPQYPESIIRVEFSTLTEEEILAANNGFEVESMTDSQTWIYNERADSNPIDQNYAQRYPTKISSYEENPLSPTYAVSSQIFDDRNYSATLPRTGGINSTSHIQEPIISPEKPQKAKSFMSSLKHLTLPRRKGHQKDRSRDESISSQASSASQLNVTLPSGSTHLAAHSLSSEYFPSHSPNPAPIRRSRSISRSFRNLFRSSSKKKLDLAKREGANEFDPAFASTSSPTPKKFSFLHRRKSKQKSNQQTNRSTNSLMNLDYPRSESSRDTPVRANVGHPVSINKSPKR